MKAQSQRGFLTRWLLNVAGGEFIGFVGIPIAGGLMAMKLVEGLPSTTSSLLLNLVAIVGGVGEGLVLGWFQLRVLRERWPTIVTHAWLRNTAGAAALAWALGMLAPTLDELFGLPVAVHIAIWVLAGVVILPSIGVAQFYVLRDHVPRARGWIGANLLGWTLGLSWTFIAPMLVPDDAPLPIFGIAFALGGLAMVASLALITGLWLVRADRSIKSQSASSP